MRIRRRTKGGIVAVTVTALAACTAFEASPEPSSPEPSSPETDGGISAADAEEPSDAGLRDALDVTDASVMDANDEAGPPENLLPSGSFETGVCSGWISNQAVIMNDSLARSGNYSCRVCGAGNVPNFSLDDGIRTPIPTVPGTYTAEAWVRAIDGMAAPQLAHPFLRQAIAQPFTAIKNNAGDPVAITTTWQRVEVSLEVTSPGGALNMYIAANPPAGGGCFLVDDARLYRRK